VPRKRPLPPQELEICRRLKAFRHASGLSRAAFARKVGVSDSVFIRLEHFRSPLQFGVFRAISAHFPINPYWLQTGNATPLLRESLGDAGLSQILPASALFSEIYPTIYKPHFDSVEEMKPQIERILKALEAVPDLIEFGLLTKKQAAKMRRLRDQLLREFEETLPFANKAEAIDASPGQVMLDISGAVADNSPVQKQIRTLGELVERLHKLTKPRGAKAALAREFRVSRQAVDQWLSRESSPSAEIALRLLQWVEQQERK
jgi:transcriptional regulator with XRE-family HTH domain